MTKRTKIFKIVICVLLALTMIWSAFSFLMYIFKDYGIYVSTEAFPHWNQFHPNLYFQRISLIYLSRRLLLY